MRDKKFHGIVSGASRKILYSDSKHWHFLKHRGNKSEYTKASAAEIDHFQRLSLDAYFFENKSYKQMERELTAAVTACSISSLFLIYCSDEYDENLKAKVLEDLEKLLSNHRAVEIAERSLVSPVTGAVNCDLIFDNVQNNKIEIFFQRILHLSKFSIEVESLLQKAIKNNHDHDLSHQKLLSTAVNEGLFRSMTLYFVGEIDKNSLMSEYRLAIGFSSIANSSFIFENWLESLEMLKSTQITNWQNVTVPSDFHSNELLNEKLVGDLLPSSSGFKRIESIH